MVVVMVVYMALLAPYTKTIKIYYIAHIHIFFIDIVLGWLMSQDIQGILIHIILHQYISLKDRIYGLVNLEIIC